MTTQVGQTIDTLTRLHMQIHGTKDYAVAMNAVLADCPAIKNAYALDRAPEKSPADTRQNIRTQAGIKADRLARLIAAKSKCDYAQALHQVFSEDVVLRDQYVFGQIKVS